MSAKACVLDHGTGSRGQIDAALVEAPSRFLTVGYISRQKPGRGRCVTRRRRQFSPELKEEAIHMVLEGERTVASVAREFGINPSALGSWVPPGTPEISSAAHRNLSSSVRHGCLSCSVSVSPVCRGR
ncbi:transposase [Streptosporangium sp. CA-115845]|uniref:transposase n=1 Tax=Streptosporangium sp. CA-115845 TaxID=3240071 RepID=UPI003D901E29